MMAMMNAKKNKSGEHESMMIGMMKRLKVFMPQINYQFL
jgi:hypothetical protein